MDLRSDDFKGLRRFESADLVHDYYLTKHQRAPSASLRRSIVSSFRQGRALFESAAATESIARPITQFYAISSICRGLALTMKPGRSESSMTPGHGLTVSTFSQTLPDLGLQTCKGLLTDLQDSLEASVYRVNSSAPEWSIPWVSVNVGSTLRFGSVATLVPSLASEVEHWTGEPPQPWAELKSVEVDDGHQTRWVFSHKLSDSELLDLFGIPGAVVDGGSVVAQDELPQLSQSYVFGSVGSVLLRRPLDGGVRLSDLGVYFVLSYALSMLARYRPSVWMAVWSGSGDDRIMPFADAFMDTAQTRFPQLAADTLTFTAMAD